MATSDLKNRLSTAARGLLTNLQGLVPKFSFDWSVFAASLEGYIDARFALLKLEIQQALNKFMRKLMIGLTMLMLLSMGFIFLSIGLIQLINTVLESAFAGYLVVALLFILIAGFIGFKFKDELMPAQEKDQLQSEDLTVTNDKETVSTGVDNSITGNKPLYNSSSEEQFADQEEEKSS